MRDVEATVAKFRNSRRAKGPPIQFGGMFTSIPFWKLETYDTEHQIEGMMEHIPTFDAYVQELRSDDFDSK